ncbi:MAG TPA: hypothetical protein VGV59_20710, partial [Pyrinomonadaceae bacterium]|nr:hypothetical protein [Pyrinomonadaceae bacterium]
SARWVEKFIAAWHFERASSDEGFREGCVVEVRRAVPPPVPHHFQRFDISNGICYTNQTTSHLAVGNSGILVHAPESRLVEIWVNEDGREPFSLALARLFFYGTQAALRRCGLFELHAAGVAPPDSDAGVLIVGASGSGKSTFAVRLAQSGWRYLTDDVIMLGEEDGSRVSAHGLRRVFSLTEATITSCAPPHLERAARAPLECDPRKRQLDPLVMFPSAFSRRCLPRALFFPVITGEAASRVTRLSQPEAMARLLRMCPWSSYDAPVARRHLRVLSLLARQCDSYSIESGRDIVERPGFAAELLAAHTKA